MNILKEGGNVFKGNNGEALTQRVNQTDVKPTLAWLEEMLPGLDLQNNMLGSTGLKPTSGDIDLNIDANAVTKEQLAIRLSQWAASHGFKPEDYVRKSGNAVHFKTPIVGNPNNGYVQTDFMFSKNPTWSSFFMRSGADSNYKGVDRAVLLSSIAKTLGYKINTTDGLIDRATGKLITADPDKIAKMLLTRQATAQDLSTVETIVAALERDPQKDAKLKDARDYFAKTGVPFFESEEPLYKEVSDVNFLARLRDRIVNQGMVALVEADQNVGGRAKGIEHIEDLVFRKGTRGIQEALGVIEHLKDNTKKSTTVKWDGKPALVFGRMPDGGFVLTDVAGFTAKGYDGMFRSPNQAINLLAKRDAQAAEQGKPAGRVEALGPMYQKLFPLLQAAIPENFKGFIQGDLLYTSKPLEVAGNLVFKPNTIEYNIPAASKLGEEIANSDVGIAIHTRYKEPGAAKQALGRPALNPVDGLLLMEPIAPVENVQPEDSKLIKQLKSVVSKHGTSIDGLFNPAELRAQQITDLPKLAVDFINYLIHNTGHDNSEVGNFDAENIVTDFFNWLKVTVTPKKYNNIVEYTQSPRSNMTGLSAAFAAFILLHDIKMDILQQLDRQVPGQEGWVVTVPGGMVKFVNRFGFTRANRAVNPKE
jgi:Family of unknown function (DUF6267)